MDILETVYEILKDDPFISKEVGNRIEYYKYPESGDMSDPIIVMEEVTPDSPSDFADNTWLKEEYFIHIEVWVKGSGGRKKRDAIAKQVRKLLWERLDFLQSGAMAPEYDKDTKVFRDARRYRGKAYRDDFDSL